MTHDSDSEKDLIDVWEAHTAAEFEQKNADAEIATMTEHPVLIHVPVNTGATGCRLVVPYVGIIAFENGKTSSEHIYWDQATVLAQMGLLDQHPPVIGDTQCGRLLDANAPVNELIKRGAPDV